MQCQKCPILAECGGITVTFNYIAWLSVPTRIEPYGKTECPLLKTINEVKPNIELPTESLVEGKMRVLVCGDRDWKSHKIIKEYLRFLKPEVVIEGECRGADLIAKEVARELGIPIAAYPAMWSKHGKAAGHVRNQQMLKEGKPDLVLAFHSDIEESFGTADMLAKAEAAGIDYVLVS